MIALKEERKSCATCACVTRHCNEIEFLFNNSFIVKGNVVMQYRETIAHGAQFIPKSCRTRIKDRKIRVSVYLSRSLRCQLYAYSFFIDVFFYSHLFIPFMLIKTSGHFFFTPLVSKLTQSISKRAIRILREEVGRRKTDDD